MSAQRCEWFALCRNVATLLVTHPTLGDVPICERCRDRFELPARPIDTKENDR